MKSGISGIPSIVATNYAHGHNGFNDGLYRPVSLITFAIEQSLFELEPSISHLINALLYGILIAVLILWLSTLFPEKPQWAFWIAMLFSVHPIHTEVVANLKSRDEILALLFFLAAAVHFIKFRAQRKIKQAVLVFLWFTLSLFSKESAVTYLGVFALITFYDNPKFSKHDLQALIPVVVPIILFLLARSMVLDQMGPVDSGVRNLLQNVLTTSDSPTERIATVAMIQGLYFTKLVLPVRLSHDYSFNAIPLTEMNDPLAIFWLCVICLVLFLTIKGLKKRKVWAFGSAFYFITMVVVANLFVLIGALAAERFLFTPSLGWCIAIVALTSQFKRLNQYLNFIFLSICLVLLTLTLLRIPDWKENYTLFKADIAQSAQSARANYNLGTAANERAMDYPDAANYLRNESILHLRKAIAIWPDYQDAYNNLGVTYMAAGETAKALETYRTLNQRFPSYTKGVFNMAIAAYKLEQYEEAELYFESYYNINPSGDLLYMLAECEGYQNKFDEAIAHLNELIQMEPNNSRGYTKLGTAYAILGKIAEAERSYQAALQLNDKDSEAHINLALVLLNTGRNAEAKATLTHVLQYDPNNVRARELLNRL